MSKIQLGRVLQSKAGNFRIELGQPRKKDGTLVGKDAKSIFPITLANGEVLNEGDILTLKTPQSRIDGLVRAGVIDADKAEAQKASIPTFVKYDVELDLEYARSGN